MNLYFFLDKCLKSSKILAYISKFVYFLVMFERNPLAVIMKLSIREALILDRQVGENSIVDNFGAFNWRPDSETVASRAFARASIIMSLEVGVLSISTEYL